MTVYGYMSIFSSHTYDRSTGTQIIENDSQKIKEINSILTEQFEDPRYECHLDQLMLFSVSFRNCKTGIYYNGLYVISLVEINHPLFITNSVLERVLDCNHAIRVNDIYSVYPSFRFDKFYTGDYFYLDESNKIVIHKPETNSHGLVRSC